MGFIAPRTAAGMPLVIPALGDLIDHYVDQMDFEGVLSLAVVDLQTGEELNLNEDVAYAGLSIMKIPIVLDMYRVLDHEPFPEIADVIEGTIVQSSNLHANILLAELGDGDRTSGASVLTSNLQRLGLLDLTNRNKAHEKVW